jgi:hypothetical protein
MWQAQFKNAWFQISNKIPIIETGIDPAADLAAIAYLGPNRQYWLTYPIAAYSSDYWIEFLRIFGWERHFMINLSTVLAMSERLLGLDHVADDLPDLWLLSAEKLPELNTTVIQTIE